MINTNAVWNEHMHAYLCRIGGLQVTLESHYHHAILTSWPYAAGWFCLTLSVTGWKNMP